MSIYLAIPLTASIALVAAGCVLVTMSPRQAANRWAGLLLFGAGYWAFCEVLWNTAPDPISAAALHRLALPGIVFMGTIGLALVSQVTERRIPYMPVLLSLSAVGSIVFLLLGWTTPLMVERMVRTSWGYGLVPGPLFGVWLGFTVVVTLGVLLLFSRASLDSRAEVDRASGPLVVVLTVATFLPGVVSDGILPVAGIQVPRVATLCFALFGATLIWAMHRYGYNSQPTHELARRIVRTLPDGLVVTSMVGRIRTANAKMESLLGVGPGLAIGLPLREIVDIPLFDPPREVSQIECDLRPMAGERIPVRLSSSIVRDHNGVPMGFMAVISDQREVAALRNRVVTSDRLAAVGQLAAGIAHEINNPLAFVRSNLNLLRQEWGEMSTELAKHDLPEAVLADSGEWEELIDESLEGVDRAATIVRDVREFSHVGSGRFEEAQLNALLDQVIRVASPQLGDRVEVLRDFAPLEPLRCRPQRLKQLFLNLIVNAAQSIEGRGTVRVSTVARGDCVVVSIADDGGGVPAELRERIFDPFFTTKEVGVGTGLGLAISHEIARAHGGEIRYEALRGGGSAFHVELARAAESVGDPDVGASRR